MKQTCWVLLEGHDDVRFFDKVLRSQLLKKYNKVISYTYAERSQETVTNFIKSLNDLNTDYIIIADFDSSTCFTFVKNKIQLKMPSADITKITIVKTEIESWYLAGVDRSNSRKLQIPYYSTTDNITKEMFNEIISSKFKSRIDFMVEILKIFDSSTAKKQNTSFRYAWNKFLF